MNSADVADHYDAAGLVERLFAALAADGLDVNDLTVEALAPYDHFHGRGLEATREIGDRLEVAPDAHLLDIGSGIGGPARYFAARFGCRVTGIDLTAAFCDAANRITELLDPRQSVGFRQGNALSMPFADATFDGAYSMNVSMNIADKRAFYTEAGRVLRPGGWFVLSEIAQGPNGTVSFPTPWARSAETSFLSTPENTVEQLAECGFVDIEMRKTVEQALAFQAKARETVQAGGNQPLRAVGLVHPTVGPEAARNTAAGVAKGYTIPVEITCRKPGA